MNEVEYVRGIVSRVSNLPDLKLTLVIDEPDFRHSARIHYNNQSHIVPLDDFNMDTMIQTLLEYIHTHPENLI